MSVDFKKSKLKYHLKVKNGREVTNEVNYDDNVIDVYGSGGVFKYTDKKLFTGPSVLFGRKGTIGKPLYVEGDFWTVDTMYYTEIYPGNSPRYFYYLLEMFPWNQIVTQTALPSIVGSEVENYELNIPSEETQKIVAKYLECKCVEIEALLKHKENLIILLEQQRQSIITEAVTKGLNPNVKMKDSGIEWIGVIPEHWEVKKVKHFANHVGSGKTPSGGSEVYLDEGVPFLRSLNVHFDGIRLKDLAFISEETNAEMKSSQVKPLDILLNITGASIGRTAIVPKDFGRANVNQHVCIIRLNQRKVYPFYFNMLMSSYVINQQIWFAQNGSSREGLNFVQVKELIFAIPPTLEEQREINKWLFNKQKAIFNLISTVKEQIEKLKEYRQSLIYEAATGKINVRDTELDEVR
ncbi:restriction endonuclease subunit S [Saccharibacillus sp. JS10]|uniref:restriction endonuclease subunit S n=1 Tax=Saccharibacillus sp. JS10 TaxID=2950552 RepID=UPI00210ED6AE|nr:restriction endonuclease subunit S [Saccharibacillus sp. JS10]MCQ4087694.1 restriction endonuclease subunit S [Saccharibacillus sp. JS10]